MLFLGENLVFGLLVATTFVWLVGIAIFITFIVTLYGYAPFYYDGSERHGSRAWRLLRRLSCWRLLRRCYKHEIVDCGYMESGRAHVPCLFAGSPHGVNAWSFVLAFLVQDETWDKRLGSPYAGVHWVLTKVPFLRDIVLSMGCVDVGGDTLTHMLLERRRNVAILPNGTREMAPATNIPAVQREGFLRKIYGMKGHADCAHFILHNEDKIYITFGDNWRLRQWMLNSPLGIAVTPYIGPLPTHPLRVYMGPRHVYVPGETYDEYRQRYWETAREMRTAIAEGRAPVYKPTPHPLRALHDGEYGHAVPLLWDAPPLAKLTDAEWHTVLCYRARLHHQHPGGEKDD